MNRKSGLVLRIVAGMYLVYLGVKLIQGALSERPSNLVFIMVMAVLFVAVGAFFAIFSLKGMIQIDKEEKAEAQAETEADTDTEDEAKGEAEEVVETQKQTLADKAARVAEITESDEAKEPAAADELPVVTEEPETVENEEKDFEEI